MRYVFKKPVYKIFMPLFDLFGGILFFPVRLFKKPISSPKSILVVRLDHIGDFVCTTPIFKNLKKKFPDAKIAVLINSASKELAYRDPHIDKVITFSPFYLERGERSSMLKGLIRVIKDIRNISFDLGIEPRGDLVSILIMWLGGVKYRVGYGITGGGFLLHKKVRYDRSTHVIDRNLALLKDLDIPVEDKSPSVYFNEKDIEAVEGILQGIKGEIKGIKWDREEKKGKAIVLHPFAGAQTRGWAMDNFQYIIDKLKKEGISTFLIGTKNDLGNYEDVIDMRGKFNLPQLAYFIKSVGYFVGLNSGPANIASALKAPSIVISSGANIIEHWIPISDNTKFIYKDVKCRPCETAFCPRGNYECMQGLDMDDIVKSIKRQIAK